MGIGRFAFTPLLPMMQADAGMSIAQGGWLASANYAGYLVGALWAAAQAVRSGFAIRAGLAVIAGVTLGMGMTDGLLPWLLLRTAAGVASAWVLIHVSAWTLGRLAPLGRPSLNGMVYAGIGAGIMAAGLLCLALMAAGARSSTAWLVIGALSAAAAAVIWRRFGSVARPGAGAHARMRWSGDALLIVACYGAFGFGYIIPATFLPAMARDAIADPSLFGWAWPAFGAASSAATLALAPLFGRIDKRKAWIACHLVMAVGVAAPLLLEGLPGILLASGCVGGTFVAVVMLGLQEAQRLSRGHPAALIGAMTAAFAAGQIAGPAFVTAWVSLQGTLLSALGVASLVLVASAFALLKRPG